MGKPLLNHLLELILPIEQLMHHPLTFGCALIEKKFVLLPTKTNAIQMLLEAQMIPQTPVDVQIQMRIFRLKTNE